MEEVKLWLLPDNELVEKHGTSREISVMIRKWTPPRTVDAIHSGFATTVWETFDTEVIRYKRYEVRNNKYPYIYILEGMEELVFEMLGIQR